MAVSYELVHVNRLGHERVHPYTSETELAPGAIVRVEGRDWLVESVEGERVRLEPARYRLVLRHPDGRKEAGAFRRYRPDAPRLGHTFSTVVDGGAGQLAGRRRAARARRAGQAVPRADRRARLQRGRGPAGLPEHELEHALAREDDSRHRSRRPARAEEAGLLVELVALEPGEAPDWDEAERYIDALILDEIEDDLLVLCGVDPGKDPRESWLGTVKERLREDLRRFRDDVEGDHDQIEEWDFRDGRIFAAVGSFDDQASPDSGHGWMARLVDVGALAAAGFSRVRKAQLLVSD